MTENTARQQVLNRLGSEEGSAGKAIVDFVEETINEKLQKNHNDLAALITEYNEANQRALSLKADKAHTDEINGRLRAAADALRGASTAHDAAAQAVNANSASAEERAQQARAATGQANGAVSDAVLTLESLNERLKKIEDWQEPAAKMLGEHDAWIKEQQRRQEHEASRVPLINQPPAEVHEHEHVHEQHHHPETRAIPAIEAEHHRHEAGHVHQLRYLDMRHWNWIQWVLAIALGLALAATLGTWLHDLTTPYLQWWSWLWWLVIFLIGFFGGGYIGSLWDRRGHEYEHEHVHEEREVRERVHA